MNDFYERISNLSQKRLVLLAMELQSRLESSERRQNEPIAILGMACRFPGGANSPEAFWELLREGRDAITEIPRDRWDINAYYNPDEDAAGKMSTRWGGFIDQIDQFDPGLFGITPREAQSMDPQQRLVLEVSWEALERAGIAPDRLSGSPTGVFIGACNSDYGQMLMDVGLDSADMYLATGGAHSVISGRVSYVLGLQGPAISVDTACSSSLVAMHYAIKSLRTGECSLALAGGVNAILSPDVTVTLSKARMMAADGRCKAFDAAADGFVRSEGVGMLVLKRLSEAQADGDPILAVIRGSAINQDGRSNGLTAPNGPSQVAVIRAALADAGLTPAEIGYVETHGTGTSLGDPIEAQALGAAYADGHTKDQPLLIGSVKSNMGHLESSAGVAGLMKLALCLQHGEVPASLHFKQPSPHIPWDDLPLRVPTALTAWQPPDGRRLGGVSSFGFSGTNVHMILEAPPAAESQPSSAESLHLLCLSAKSEKSLRALAAGYQQFLAATPAGPERFAAIAATANTGRARLPHRLAVVAADGEQARQRLADFSADPAGEDLIRSAAPVARPPEATFLFTGHGAQYAHMGRALYETQPVFRQALDRCNELARPYLEKPLLSAIFPEPGAPDLLSGMAYTQPALFALQIALAELLRSWGIQPAAVAGHSLGEYAAAVVAGVFSLEDGLKLVAARGRLMENAPQTGSMAAIFATEEQVAGLIRPYSGQLSIAVINAPTNIVISGVREAVEAALADCEAQAIKTRRLAVAQAAHSPLIDPLLDEFEAVAATIQFSPPRLDLISCTTGEQVSAAEVTTPGYWRRHLRQPVQFARLMETLHQQGKSLFVEIGPHPVLLSIGQRVLPAGYGAWVPTLREGHAETRQMLEALGMLFVNGVDVDWQGYYRGVTPARVGLPTYPFDHQRYWMSVSPGAVPAHPAGLPPGASPLLGIPLRSPELQATVYETRLGANWPPYLDHHRIFGTPIAPSPVYIEMALRGAEELFGPGAIEVNNLAIQEALVLPEDSLRPVQVIFDPPQDGRAGFRVASLSDDGRQWKLHTTGQVTRPEQPAASDPAAALRLIAEVQQRCAEQISGPDYYAGVAGLGLEFGTSFHGLQHIWRRDGEALGKVQLPESLQADSKHYRIHPAFLDACFHLLGAPLPGARVESAYLLIGIERFRLHRPPSGKAWNHTILVAHGGETFTGDIRLYDEDGSLLAEALGLTLKRASRELLLRSVRPRFDDWFYQVSWQARPLPAGIPLSQPAGGWVILPDQGGVAQALAGQITAAGQPCRILQAEDAIPSGAAVIYLGGLDAPSALADGPAASLGQVLLAGQVDACLGALQIVQQHKDARLWIASRSAQPLSSAAVDPAQAAVWGLGRVIALEHPEQWGGLVDLDPAQTPSEQAACLLAELRSADGEDQVAYRLGQRYIARLARAAAPPAAAPGLDPQGAYLVTGGLGGLGLLVGRWLAEAGAPHLVLIGRRGLPPRAEWPGFPPESRQARQAAAIQEMEALGARVEVVAADVGDYAAMQALIASFSASRPALKGVIHTAADLSNHRIDELTAADLSAMFWPKVAGTWNLHSLTRGLGLDFFVLFSSSTALWGSSQLGHYAAANTFLDAFAHARRSQGLPALSVNWGTWEAMRVASQSEQQLVAQFGLEQMPAEAALAILGNLLAAGTTQITVAAVDWTLLKAAYQARRARPFLELVESKKPAPAPAAVTEQKASLAQQLEGLKPEERREFLVSHVRQQVAKVISASEADLLDAHQGLFDMGMDSLMSVELKSRLEKSTGKPLPSTLTFNYPTIADLAGYLDEVVLKAAEPAEVSAPPAVVAPAPEAPAGDIDELSEDELAALLLRKLGGAS
jgi:acyl transferase domain-containing protein/acyl carrier protein